jgi:transaldolase
MSVSKVAEAGTSIWLDDLSRAKLNGTDSHSLPARIANSGVVGVTTNPSIFSAAISGAAEYAADIALMKSASVDEVVKKLTTDDVRAACDLFAEIFSNSKGLDFNLDHVDLRGLGDLKGRSTFAVFFKQRRF